MAASRTLGDVAEVAANLPRADCFLRAKGTTVTLGIPRRTYVPGDLCLRSLDRAGLPPGRLYAMLLRLYGAGSFAEVARGEGRILSLDAQAVRSVPLPE
jgi:hypothetical protein